MKQCFKLLCLIGMTIVFAACGERATEKILGLGGISSTGNKEENTADKKQDSNVPLAPGEICVNQLDLSPRVYRNVSTGCGQSTRENACIMQLKFEDRSTLIATFAKYSEDMPPLVTANYNACGQSIKTSIHETDLLTLSEDQKTIFDEQLGTVFKLLE